MEKRRLPYFSLFFVTFFLVFFLNFMFCFEYVSLSDGGRCESSSFGVSPSWEDSQTRGNVRMYRPSFLAIHDSFSRRQVQALKESPYVKPTRPRDDFLKCGVLQYRETAEKRVGLGLGFVASAKISICS